MVGAVRSAILLAPTCNFAQEQSEMVLQIERFRVDSIDVNHSATHPSREVFRESKWVPLVTETQHCFLLALLQ